MGRVALFGVFSSIAAIAVMTNAVQEYKQFYIICKKLIASSSSLLVLGVFGVYCIFLLSLILQRLLFGPLRIIEEEHVHENVWYSVSEMFLAMTVFRDEFNLAFVTGFSLLLIIKIYHWLLKDRIDFMEQSPSHDTLFYVRILGIMNFLLVTDVFFLVYTFHSLLQNGASVLLLFCFEFAILSIFIAKLCVRFSLNVIERRSAEPWDDKTMYMFYLELFSDLLKLLFYIAFFVSILSFYGLPLHIIRDLYVTLASFVNRIKDLIQYRRAIGDMDRRFPIATLEELNATDKVCIICREEMEEARVLPCGHLFHFSCLKSWMARQQTCPTCRNSVLSDPTPRGRSSRQEARENQSTEGTNRRDQIERNDNQRNENQRQNLTLQVEEYDPFMNSEAIQVQQGDRIVRAVPIQVLASASSEELLELEGQEVRNIEARIQYLRQMQMDIDRVASKMNRYNRVISGSRVNVSSAVEASEEENGEGNERRTSL